MKPILSGAIAVLVSLTCMPAAFASEPITYKGPVTLDSGVSTLGTIQVSSDTPLPVTVISGGGTLGANASTAPPTYTDGQLNVPLWVDLTGRFGVRAIQDGTWNVTMPGGVGVTGPAGATCPSQSGAGSVLRFSNYGECVAIVGTDGVLVSFNDVRQVAQSLTGTLNSTAAFAADGAQATVQFYLTGFNGGSVQLEQTVDGSNWTVTSVYQGGSPVAANTMTVNGSYGFGIQGRTQYRLKVTVANTSGNFTVAYSMSKAPKYMDAIVNGPTDPQAAVTGRPVYVGCRTATAAPTASTDGQGQWVQCGVDGKSIVKPYAIKELDVRGSISGTDTAAHTIIAAAGANLKNYITGVQCGNTSSTATTLTFSDSAASTLYVPATGGNNMVFPTPLVTAVNTAFTFTAGTGVTTASCNAQGYVGP